MLAEALSDAHKIRGLAELLDNLTEDGNSDDLTISRNGLITASNMIMELAQQIVDALDVRPGEVSALALPKIGKHLEK